MRTLRSDSTSTDSVWVTTEERKKWDKAIEKGSRILERYPDEVEYKPEVLFVIGESFRLKGQWKEAIVKYNEFERYFAQHDSMPTVEFQRAYCHFKAEDFAMARFNLELVLEKGDKHPWHQPALELFALVEEKQEFPAQAIEALEALLAKSEDEFMRAKVHFRLGRLYMGQKEFSKSREHYNAPEIQLLSSDMRYTAAYNAAECSIEMRELDDALHLLDTLAKNPEFFPRRHPTLIRKAEVLFLAARQDSAYTTLYKVIQDSSKSVHAAHAWFLLGDHEQMVVADYPTAIAYYDSCKTSHKFTKWSRQAEDRIQSLQQLMTYNTRKGSKSQRQKPTLQDDFMIAELFLFRLDEPDSALVKLDSIIINVQSQLRNDQASIVSDSATSVPDSGLFVRALYAKAFIFDEFKQEDLVSDSLYRYIIRVFPNTDHAKQAQKILGEPVTVQTKEDLAYQLFLQAEQSMQQVQLVPSDSIAMVDSLFAVALTHYDSVHNTYPGTQYGAKALYARAWYFENQEFNQDSARAEYQKLAANYSGTELGLLAQSKLDAKVSYNEEQLQNMRKRVQEQKQIRIQTQKDRQEAAKPKVPEIKQEQNEVLSDDYEDLYNLE
jgi:tetratricopeptide (TPR) repeat protein